MIARPAKPLPLLLKSLRNKNWPPEPPTQPDGVRCRRERNGATKSQPAKGQASGVQGLWRLPDAVRAMPRRYRQTADWTINKAAAATKPILALAAIW